MDAWSACITEHSEFHFSCIWLILMYRPMMTSLGACNVMSFAASVPLAHCCTLSEDLIHSRVCKAWQASTSLYSYFSIFASVPFRVFSLPVILDAAISWLSVDPPLVNVSGVGLGFTLFLNFALDDSSFRNSESVVIWKEKNEKKGKEQTRGNKKKSVGNATL